MSKELPGTMHKDDFIKIKTVVKKMYDNGSRYRCLRCRGKFRSIVNINFRKLDFWLCVSCLHKSEDL